MKKKEIAKEPKAWPGPLTKYYQQNNGCLNEMQVLTVLKDPWSWPMLDGKLCLVSQRLRFCNSNA